MAAVHDHTISLPVLPSRVQLACNGVYVALPQSRAVVKVWSLQDVTCKPLELVGHSRMPTAVAFGHRPQPTLLCTAADDYVIVWNVEKARACLTTGQQIRGTIIGQTLGSVQYVAFSPDDRQVAVCAYKQVYILDAKTEHTELILDGHDAAVNCAEFCPHYTSTVVTVGDDRTYKVWDVSSGSLVYQSTILSSSPFISLTMSYTAETFALGTADGQVHIFDLTDGNGFRRLYHMDVHKLTNQIQEALDARKETTDEAREKGPVTVSSRPSWQRSDHTVAPPADVGDDDDDDAADSELGCSALSLLYTRPSGDHSRAPTPARLGFLQQDNTLVSDLLEHPPMLVIGTTSGILQVNARTMEPCQYSSFKEPMDSSSLLVDGREAISLCGNMALSQHGTQNNKISGIVGALFTSQVHILQVLMVTHSNGGGLRTLLAQSKEQSSNATREQHGSWDSGDATTLPTDGNAQAFEERNVLSVLSSAPLAQNSPLLADMSPKAKDPKPAAGRKPSSRDLTNKPGSLDKQGKIIDRQAIVFKDKVKSSGYTSSEPRRTMFQPKTNVPPSVKSSAKSSKPSSVKSLVREYPMTGDAPTNLVKKLDVADRPTAINSVQFSGDAQSLACALGNYSAQVFKVPLSGKGCAFAGHSGVVTSARWSHDNQWLVTSGEDKMAAVWSPGLPDPVLTLKLTNHNMGVDKESGLKPDRDNPLFSKPIRFAQFYYMDKFLLLSSGNSFSLYKYHLDAAKSDIKRYISKSRYKLVKSLQMTESQQITAFSAINSFHSYLAICSGTNKALEVFDLNVCRSVRVTPDVHTRAPHVIRQNSGSAYVSHASSAYDLFVTAAAGDCIKLWDLRSDRCVRRYEGHANRSQPCGLAISPCSRFIATGSEDRSAYIFDIRSGTYLHKLTGHTDTVADVDFHPLHPQILTATLDGKLRLFVNK